MRRKKPEEGEGEGAGGGAGRGAGGGSRREVQRIGAGGAMPGDQAFPFRQFTRRFLLAA